MKINDSKQKQKLKRKVRIQKKREIKKYKKQAKTSNKMRSDYIKICL